MINQHSHTLANGLQIVVNCDRTSKLAAVNLLYRVGARNENPRHTGFAHLFEHLMFRGTKLIPDFDTPVQLACGDNNAFTNNDYTDFYISLPKDNIETVFWLESDRMVGLDIDSEKLSIEKRVVIEEFNQRYLNQPYGDQWMLLRALTYTKHPYRWATIGLSPDHIRRATLRQVGEFYHRYYTPSNAILSVSGDVEVDHIFEMADKWFGRLPYVERAADNIEPEPEQTAARRNEVVRNVPADQITIAFPMGDRLSREYYLFDLISDLLAGGSSARLYNSLVKRRGLFSSTNAYITGDMDCGLVVIVGQLMPHVSVEVGEAALWDEIELLKRESVGQYELEKVKNKFEANALFGELNVMNKALNLGYYAMLGRPDLLNGEVDIFRSITTEEIMETCREKLTPERSSTLIIRADEKR